MAPDVIRHALVHHARAFKRVGKLVDQRFVFGAFPGKERILHRFEQTQLFDALRGEVRIQLLAGDSPELFAVRLEKNLEQPAPEPVHDPILEGAVLLDRRKRIRNIAEPAARRLERPKPGQCVKGLEWVIKELALVIDAREAVHHPVVAPNDLQPQLVDAAVAAEESVRPEIDGLVPQAKRSRQPADGIARLVDVHLDPFFCEFIRRGDARGARANDGYLHRFSFAGEPAGYRYCVRCATLSFPFRCLMFSSARCPLPIRFFDRSRAFLSGTEVFCTSAPRVPPLP